MDEQKGCVPDWSISDNLVSSCKAAIQDSEEMQPQQVMPSNWTAGEAYKLLICMTMLNSMAQSDSQTELVMAGKLKHTLLTCCGQVKADS